MAIESASIRPSRRPHSAVLAEAIERVVRAGEQPIRAAFLTRALNALARLTPELGEQELVGAAGASSDYAALLASLRSPAATAALRGQVPLVEARLRGLDQRDRLLRTEGGTLGVDEVARHLGLSRQAVDKRRRAGRLLALDTGRRGYAYPAWQLAPRGVLAGLEEVLAALQVQDAWMRATFFLSQDPRLDGATPLAELRRGNLDAVRRAAGGYGEHSAA